MRMPRLLIGVVVLVACKGSRSGPPPNTEARSATTNPARTVASDAAPTVTLPPGQRFERGFPGAKLELGAHDVLLENLLLESTGAEAVSLSFGVIEHGFRNGSATLADHFEVIDGGAHVAPLVVQTVELNPHNGGRSIHAYDGEYLVPMKDSVLTEIRLVFASHLSPPAAAVRITLDHKPLEIPLLFGPPTTIDVPPPSSTSMIACDKLARCCAAQSSAQSQAACTDLADSARRLGMPEQCASAASSYCH